METEVTSAIPEGAAIPEGGTSSLSGVPPLPHVDAAMLRSRPQHQRKQHHLAVGARAAAGHSAETEAHARETRTPELVVGATQMLSAASSSLSGMVVLRGDRQSAETDRVNPEAHARERSTPELAAQAGSTSGAALIPEGGTSSLSGMVVLARAAGGQSVETEAHGESSTPELVVGGTRMLRSAAECARSAPRETIYLVDPPAAHR